MKLSLSILLCVCLLSCNVQRNTTANTADAKKADMFLDELLKQYPQYFDTLLRNNAVWQIQIIYTQIDRYEKNKPSFTHHYFNVNPSQYFYPASTVKLPVAILALQKLNELDQKGLDKHTSMITEAEGDGQTAVYNDPSSVNGSPSIAHYIKKILLTSDNDAFNRLYEFLGQEYINEQLKAKGYDKAQILHRLSLPLSENQNRTTNSIRFIDTSGKTIYQQPQIKSSMVYQPRTNLLGKGYYSGGKLVQQPFDFSKKNLFTLPDLHTVIQSVMFPDAVSKKQRFNLKEEDYSFLHRYMSMYPRESSFPAYDSSYNDAYVKFLLYGANDPVKPNVRIFNKVGDAYGFLIDAAYVADFENNVEFMLSAVIHCNPDGIYNDDKYEYEKVGFPFMKNLGQVIYNYEKTRKRQNVPDLSSFKITYGQ